MPDETSEIDDKAFFLSPDGQSNAQAELDATIYALINETSFDDNATACRFPARKMWLVEELNMDDLVKVECKTFDKLIERMDPQSASLIFPSAYINSPASMFGHTFIRIDSSLKSKMLSYAINYAADANTETESGMVFAVKGLFGGYYGKYSLLPYYEKIKEYRDSEERDIWEYDLNLTQKEVIQMMRHIWELQNTYSWYYFFTENCSYNMLWLIEAARESAHLREYFTYQVIPPETIHAIIEQGLVTKRHYRPARQSKLLAYEKHLDENDIESVFSLVNESRNVQSFLYDGDKTEQNKRYILEAASEFIEYDYLANNISEDTYRKRLHSVLTARSSLGKGDKIDIATPVDPMEGHRAARARVETGWRDGDPIQFVGIRPANHNIKDGDIGFLRGTQIEFFDLLLSRSKHDIDLEKATLLSITALPPRGKFFKPFSWRVGVGWDKNYLSEKAEFTGNVSGGFTWKNAIGYTYILADALFYTDRDLISGIGGVAGAVLYEGSRFKTNFEMTQRLYDTGHEQSLFSASQHYQNSQNSAFSLSYNYVEKYGRNMDTVKISFDYFF